MASSLVVEDPSISKIGARSVVQIELQGLWKSRNFRPILRTSWWLLLACLLPLQLYYGHQTVREKLYSLFSLFMAYTCTEYRLVHADTTTQPHLSHTYHLLEHKLYYMNSFLQLRNLVWFRHPRRPKLRVP